MGTDIHLFIEYFDKYADCWVTWGNEYDLLRDYRLFGIIANVRNSGKIYFEPKGLPIDVSERVKNYNCEGFHSYSWLNYSEVKKVLKILKKLEIKHLDFIIISKILKALEKLKSSARIVFMFDS